MMEQQPLSAADVGAVMRANYGYGMPMYPMMGMGGFGGGFGFGGDFLSILLLFALSAEAGAVLAASAVWVELV